MLARYASGTKRRSLTSPARPALYWRHHCGAPGDRFRPDTLASDCAAARGALPTLCGRAGHELPRFTGIGGHHQLRPPYHNEARGAQQLHRSPAGDYEVGGVFISGIRTNGRPKETPPAQRTPPTPSRSRTSSSAIWAPLPMCPLSSRPRTWAPSMTAARRWQDDAHPRRAVEVVNVLEPGIVVPMMYRTPDLNADLGA